MLRLKKRGEITEIILGLIVIALLMYALSYPLISYVKVHFFNESGSFIFPWEGEFKPYKEKLSEEDLIVINSMNALVKSINALVKGENIDKYGTSAPLEQTNDKIAIYRYDLTYWFTHEDTTGIFWGDDYKNRVMKSSGGTPYDDEGPVQGTFVLEIGENENEWIKEINGPKHTKVEKIKMVHNVGLKVYYINTETDETWEIEYQTIQVKKEKDEWDSTDAIGAEGKSSCEKSPTWVQAPGIKVFYCKKWDDNKNGGTGYIESWVIPCTECKEKNASIKHEEHTWFGWVLTVVGNSVKDSASKTWDFATEFFGGHPNMPVETGCEDGYMEGGVCIKCDAAKRHCAITGFELPQKDACKDSTGWIAGAGDPKYVAYAEGFPQGEESGWQIDTLDVMSDVVLQGAVLNAAFAGIGPLIKPIRAFFKSPLKTTVAATKGIGTGATKAAKTAATKEGRAAIKEALKKGLQTITSKEGWKIIGKEFFDPAKFAKQWSRIASVLKKPLAEFSKESAEKMVAALVKEGLEPEDAIRLVSKEFGERILKGVSMKYGIEFGDDKVDDIARLFLEHYSDDAGKLGKQGTKLINEEIKKTLEKGLTDDLKKKYAAEIANAQVIQIYGTKKIVSELSSKDVLEYFTHKATKIRTVTQEINEVFQRAGATLPKGPEKLGARELIKDPKYLEIIKNQMLKESNDELNKKIARELTEEFADDAAKIFSKTVKELKYAKDLENNFADRFAKRYVKEVRKKGGSIVGDLFEKEVVDDAIKNQLPKLLDNVHPKYYGILLRRAEIRLLKEGTPGYSLAVKIPGTKYLPIDKSIHSGIPWKRIAIQTDLAKKAVEEEREKIISEIAEAFEKNFAELVDSGRYETQLNRLIGIAKDTGKFPIENKRYIAALGIAALAAYADSVDEKYKSVGVNDLAVSSPSLLGLQKKSFDLDSASYNYFIRLDKGARDDAFTSRWYFASPCKTDLDLRKQVCICAGENARIDKDTGQSAYYLKEFGDKNWVPVKNVEDDGAMEIKQEIMGSTGTRSAFTKYVLMSGISTVESIREAATGKLGYEYPVNKIIGGDESNAFRECNARGWWDEQIGYYNNINTKTMCVSISTQQSKYKDYNNGCNYCYTGEQYGKTVFQGLVLVGQIAVEMGASAVLGPAGTIAAHLATGAGSSWLQHEIAQEYKWPTH